ncbi:not available [Pontoporia blainvillei]|uniref:Not available n=1 Tax=Pontoporia blainvillei TaxID=48723 RepID=A0ABX0S1G4_PONBL|nr:not available [Pontoporia blainvillei]
MAREPPPQTPAGSVRWRRCGKCGSPGPLTRVPNLRHPIPVYRPDTDVRAEAAGLTSPHRTSRHRPAPGRRSATAQPEHSLLPPHGPGHLAAPPAHGGHVHSSAPTSSSRGSRRLHRAPARDSLSGSPQRRGPGAGKSEAALHALGPPRHAPKPCQSGRGCRVDGLARRQEADVNEGNARGPEEGSGKGGGGVSVRPPNKEGG